MLLRPVENRFLFRPLTAAEDWEPPPPGLRPRDVELTGADGTRLHAWWVTPQGWAPGRGALLDCHGNAGNLSHRGEGLRRWRDELGQAVLIFDYPGYGKSGGRPTEAGCYAAADAAYDWLLQQQVPPRRLLLFGGSLGGAVATDVAVRRPHRALVLLSAFTSFFDMARLVAPWLAARWLLSNRLDNLAKIGKVRGPVFVAHGTADRVVPFEQGRRLFAAAGEPKEFFPLHGLDHNDAPGPAFYAALRDFLARTDPAP